MTEHREAGFTLVEMIIVVVMTTVISMVVFGIGYQYLKQAASLHARTNFYGDRLNAADFLRHNIGLSSGLLNQNSVPDTNPLVADPEDTTGTLWKHIHAIPGSFGDPSGITPVLYYSQDALDASHKAIMNGTEPFQNEFIIYHDGPSSELRVRTLANPAATGNALVSTCTTAVSGCPKDKVLLTGVKTVDMSYFSRAGENIDFRSSCDPDMYYCAGTSPPACLQTEPYTGCNGLDFSQAEVAQFKLNVKKPIESDVQNNIYNSTIIRIALRNA